MMANRLFGPKKGRAHRVALKLPADLDCLTAAVTVSMRKAVSEGRISLIQIHDLAKVIESLLNLHNQKKVARQLEERLRVEKQDTRGWTITIPASLAVHPRPTAISPERYGFL